MPLVARWSAVLVVGAFLAGCQGESQPLTTPTDPDFQRQSQTAPQPGALVDVTAGSASARIWPFLSADLATPHDPVNLIFAGAADPRDIRSALLRLDGNRVGFGFPSIAPFDCTWSDAVGSLQGGYSASAGWSGSAIQLQCGVFGPIRFHLRLFRAGPLTLGGVHFEVLIPGTTDHQVLSWELAEQLVTADMARTGLLGASPGATGPMSPAPSFRTIPAIIYNGLPDGLKQLAKGPLGTVAADVPIVTDGRATVLTLAGRAGRVAGGTSTFTIQFDQVIPRPFCAKGPEYLYVSGPVAFEKTVRWNGDALRTEYRATGALVATPIDPASGEVAGASYRAAVSDQQTTTDDGRVSAIAGTLRQTELPAQAPGLGRLLEQIEVRERVDFRRDIDCNPR